jgi:ethanolamine utilization protein EutQ (cupin superfamily)
MSKIKELCKELESVIESSYTTGVTMEEAERLAARFLYGQMVLSAELRTATLDAKMRKSGVKAVRAAIYLSEVQKNEKKPSDVLLNALVDSNEIVAGEEEAMFKAEVDSDELSRYYDIFGQAHVYYRQVSKGVQG